MDEDVLVFRPERSSLVGDQVEFAFVCKPKVKKYLYYEQVLLMSEADTCRSILKLKEESVFKRLLNL